MWEVPNCLRRKKREEQLASGGCGCVPGLFILDQASVIGDIGVRTACDLMCSGVQRTVVTYSRGVSQVSLEWLLAKKPFLYAIVLSPMLLGSLEALQSFPWHSEIWLPVGRPWLCRNS